MSWVLAKIYAAIRPRRNKAYVLHAETGQVGGLFER